jgi:hypothetical protein
MKKILLILFLCLPVRGAEFLIYDKTNWMHDLTPTQQADYRKRYENWDERVDGQYIKGDVVEVRPDGFWTTNGRGFDRRAYRVLKVPGLAVKTAQNYRVITATKKSRYNISTGTNDKIKTVSNIIDVSIEDKELTAAKKHLHIIVAIIMLSHQG